METSSLQDKTVMVTGTNRGMGKATALALATMGMSVILVSRDKVKGGASSITFVHFFVNRSEQGALIESILL